MFCVLLVPSFVSQAKLEQITSNALASTITVSMPQIDESSGPIRYKAITLVLVTKCFTMLSYRYYYIVVSLELLEDTKAIEESNLEARANTDLPFYVTASVDYENFNSHFTIGDGSNSTDPTSNSTFYNAPLQKQQEYYYFVRAYSRVHDHCIHVSCLDVSLT